MMARKTTRTVAVDSVRHKDKRRKVPTEELRDSVADDEMEADLNDRRRAPTAKC
jgi:hypothetical protein